MKEQKRRIISALLVAILSFTACAGSMGLGALVYKSKQSNAYYSSMNLNAQNGTMSKFNSYYAYHVGGGLRFLNLLRKATESTAKCLPSWIR